MGVASAGLSPHRPLALRASGRFPPKGEALIVGFLAALSLALPASAAPAKSRPVTPGRIVVDLSPAGLRNTFRPEVALGAGVDGSLHGGVARLYTPHNVEALRKANLRPLTYRLRTELGIAAWHWNPEGAWSDPAHSQGYWTSSDKPGAPIEISYGYPLPRRGDTIDMANNNGFSRLDDGDLATFWKSNPYLDPHYAKTEQKPQWLVIELGGKQVVDTADIAWGEPYARRYRVQYWVGHDEYDREGGWIDFPRGEVRGGQGGHVRLDLGPSREPTGFIRVIMEEGSGTAPPGADDPRDRMGYAVREVGFGHTGPDGVFHDAVRHGTSKDTQSIAHVSSTDPWHRASDRSADYEQPGVDLFYRSPLSNGLPAMMAVGVLYDTPENAAALVRYLKARNYPIARLELGEEPDGQYVDGADYGALYLETYDILRAIDPTLVMGGPSLQSGLSDTWLNNDPDRSWNSHFIRYLKARGRLADLQFFSFEHYPFDDICGDIYAKLVQQTHLMEGLFARVRAEGVPDAIPWYIAEYGFSAFSGRAESEIPGALLMANIIGQFLTEGGDGAYLFGYPPNWPINQHQACAGYGNLMLYQADEAGEAKHPMPMLRAAQLITEAWLARDGEHQLHAATARTARAADGDSVKVFAARRPDGKLGLMIVNRDPRRGFRFTLASKGGARLGGPADLWSYTARHFQWIDDGPESRPGRNLPPDHRKAASLAGGVMVAPASITVLTLNLNSGR